MKFIKRILIAAVAAFAVAFAPPVRSQTVYYPTIAINGGTNYVLGAATNTTTCVAVLSAKRGLNLAVCPSFKLVGAGTSPVVFKFGASVDGTNYTAAAQTISVTASTTNVVSTTANWIVGSIGYYRLETVENPNATAITNLTLLYVSK